MKVDVYCTDEELEECRALVRLHRRWKLRRDKGAIWWSASAVRKQVWMCEVHLVGPTLARGNLYVPVKEFLQSWEPA